MKALLVVGLLAFGVQNAMAIDPDNWGPTEVKLVTPLTVEALDKKVAATVKKLEGQEEVKKQVVVTSLETYKIELSAGKNSMKGLVIANISVDGSEPVATRLSTFCHVHSHEEGVEHEHEHEHEGEEGEAETPEQHFLESVDCH